MPFEPTFTRLWKRLSPGERLAAATHFWEEPPEALVPAALGAIVGARHLRPQTARAMPADQRARALGAVLDPGDTLAAFLLVSLHLGERRPLLSAFLDALGLPHEEGTLTEEADQVPPPSEEAVRAAVKAVAAIHPAGQVETYLNTLWLQDPERWATLSQGDGTTA